jgi:hypothetical protein
MVGGGDRAKAASSSTVPKKRLRVPKKVPKKQLRVPKKRLRVPKKVPKKRLRVPKKKS